jgi:hypothetical protein
MLRAVIDSAFAMTIRSRRMSNPAVWNAPRTDNR